MAGHFETYHDGAEDVDDSGSESDMDYDSDDSETDPSYTILEETNSKLANLEIKKKSKPSNDEDDFQMEFTDEVDLDDVVPNVSTPDENNDKDIDEVLKIIKAGKLEKLKVDQCKTYLRRNGLRLTGNKDTLIQRINEHLEIVNGGGEKRYPQSSFILNCKGDACTGDVVMFEQNVYEMYNIASRSSKGPSCGTRTVAGRIVKESYGASKQQHTFTIEVLWSKGEKPLPPLHPLLIKGRNLYRLKTMRQSWEDEGERQKVLKEKHARGTHARSKREVRVLEKEKRKELHGKQKKNVLQENRVSRNDSFNQSILTSAGITLAEPRVALQHQQRPLYVNSDKQLQPRQFVNGTMQTIPDRFDNRRIPEQVTRINYSSQNNYWNQAASLPVQLQRMDALQNIYQNQPSRTVYDSRSLNPREYMVQTGQHNHKQLQPCRYYAQGRCYYGDNCKFSHGVTEDRDQWRREERWR